MTEIKKLHPDGLTSLPSTAKLFDMSESTIRRKWKKGLFPKPVKPKSSNPSKAKNYFKNSDLIEYRESLNYEEPA